MIHAFWKGATPEGIVQSFDTLKLPDVYVVLDYYLAYREDVDACLARRDENFDAALVRGLFRRLPEMDLVRVQDVGLTNTQDHTILN